VSAAWCGLFDPTHLATDLGVRVGAVIVGVAEAAWTAADHKYALAAARPRAGQPVRILDGRAWLGDAVGLLEIALSAHKACGDGLGYLADHSWVADDKSGEGLVGDQHTAYPPHGPDVRRGWLPRDQRHLAEVVARLQHRQAFPTSVPPLLRHLQRSLDQDAQVTPGLTEAYDGLSIAQLARLGAFGQRPQGLIIGRRQQRMFSEECHDVHLQHLRHRAEADCPRIGLRWVALR